MQRVKHIPHYTYDDYKSWKGDWELIEGLPFSMSPSASGRHQFIQGELLFQIKGSLKHSSCKNLCTVYSDLDWIVNSETVLRPDISVVCGSKITGFIEQPPVLIIEILSQSTAYNDRIVKKDIYEANGVKYYMIADPDTKEMVVYELSDGKYVNADVSSFQLSGNCGLKLDFETIWE